VKSNPSTHRHASTVNNIHSHSYPTRNHRNKENADPNSVFRNHKLQVCSGLTHGGGVVISILEEAVPGCSLPKLLRDVIPSPNVCLNLMTCPMRVTSFTIYHLKYRFEDFLGFTSLHVFDCETRWGMRCFGITKWRDVNSSGSAFSGSRGSLFGDRRLIVLLLVAVAPTITIPLAARRPYEDWFLGAVAPVPPFLPHCHGGIEPSLLPRN
jgi:hypothetical protein